MLSELSELGIDFDASQILPMLLTGKPVSGASFCAKYAGALDEVIRIGDESMVTSLATLVQTKHFDDACIVDILKHSCLSAKSFLKCGQFLCTFFSGFNDDSTMDACSVITEGM
jgi:hypothetical protein